MRTTAGNEAQISNDELKTRCIEAVKALAPEQIPIFLANLEADSPETYTKLMAYING